MLTLALTQRRTISSIQTTDCGIADFVRLDRFWCERRLSTVATTVSTIAAQQLFEYSDYFISRRYWKDETVKTKKKKVQQNEDT
ncbi:unnamed protein product [Notodromas monacha]|uniref:Uncharacterized protein n=1 Tax=Notodromas monacha TaxID=399045 RepID=A0A7R9GH47_9CRUS|nr:unnamed protein product [Notodromas monacha]CAG0920924.1 unnamed protein product [Notodromas monacha]